MSAGEVVRLGFIQDLSENGMFPTTIMRPLQVAFLYHLNFNGAVRPVAQSNTFKDW